MKKKHVILLFISIFLFLLIYFLNSNNPNSIDESVESDSLVYVDKELSDVKDSISVVEDSSGKKTIRSSQLEVWLQSTGRYGLKLLSSGSTVYYSQDSAHTYILREGQSFPTTGLPSNFSNFALKSFTVSPSGVIEMVRYDNDFEYTLRISIVNATSLGGYMKVEMEAYNKTTGVKQMGVSFNQDTMINGNDSAPFKIVDNGWTVFSGDVQATAYYQDVFHTTQTDSIYLGQYSSQYPMSSSNFYPGMADIYPGDSGAGFYYNLENVSPYSSRKESWIIGVGPKNANPSFDLTSPSDNSTYFSGQVVPISGIVKDTDVGDSLQVKWAIDGGAENILTSLNASGSNQNFNYNYIIPSNLSQGWHTFQFWVMDDKGGVSSSNTKQIYVNNFIIPGNPTFSNITNNSMTVNFDKRGNEASTTYELYKTIDGISLNQNSSNVYNATNLSVNTRYGYKVRAKNTLGAYTEYSSITYKYTLANAPNNGSIDGSVGGTAKLRWGSNGNPSSTTYVYEIKNKATGTVVKTGSTTNTSVDVSNIPTEVYYNIYVRALNGDNVATSDLFLGEFYQDVTAPNVSHSLNPSSWTKGDVTISINSSDAGSDVKTIEKPDGSLVSVNSTNYTVSTNGVYSFKVSDNVGNVTIHQVTVSNIDKVNPTIPLITNNDEWTLDSSVSVSISGASDTLSGLKNIEYKLDNGSWSTYSNVFNISKKGITKITARAVDNVGNLSSEVISYVKIDTPSVVSITKNTSNWTPNDITLSIVGSDVDGGVSKFILPNNSELAGSNINYTIKNNGTYKFIAVDSYGNFTTVFETISNIDKEKPSKPIINLSSTVWSPKGVHFNISNLMDVGSGVSKIEYRYNNGNWNTYTTSSEVIIPDNLQGIINIEARVIDKVGNVSETDTGVAKIDDIKPIINKVEIIKVDADTQGFKVNAIDNESGINTSGAYTYYFKSHGTDTDFRKVSTNITNSIYNIPTTPSSTLNYVKAHVRDNNNNISDVSRILSAVSAPVVSEIKVGGEGEYDNTVIISLDNAIGQDVKVEIYRGSTLINVLSSGNQYKDKNLYYEKTYEYKLIAFANVDGERVESLPEIVSVEIGSPTLEAKPDSSVYKITPFSNEVSITGEVAFAQGGTALIEVYDKSSRTLKNKNGTDSYPLSPQIKTYWKSIIILNDSEISNKNRKMYRLELDLEEFKGLDMYKKSWDINVDYKDVEINSLDNNLSNSLYK